MTKGLERDLAFMQTPIKWPRWPLLPLTMRHGTWENDRFCAFAFADGRPVIYFGIIYMVPKVAKGTTWEQALSSFGRQEFASFDELAAEYTVD